MDVCPKCSHFTNVMMEYHVGWAPRAIGSPRGRRCPNDSELFNVMGEPHFHYTCARCGYDWCEEEDD